MSFIRKDDAPINLMLLSCTFVVVSMFVLAKAINNDIDNTWPLIPITLLGTIFLYENIYTLNSKRDLFSAISLFLAFGFGFFFIVPLNQVIWDYWPSIPVGTDMRHWTGIWSSLAIVGFFLISVGYKLVHVNQSGVVHSEINTSKMHKPFLIGITICLFAQFIVLIKLGGMSGYLNAYELRLESSIQVYNPYKGLGFLFTFSESLPNLLAIYIVLLIKDKEWASTYKTFLFLMLFLFSVNMIFGGLRGSRSTTVWSLFWFLIIYKNNIKELSLRVIFSLGIGLFLFMTVYSLFKFGGVEGIQGLWDDDVKAQIYEDKYIEDKDKFTLVRDAGRADVQSYILKTYWNNEYPLSYGRTLLAGSISFVPSFLLPYKPSTAVKEKTGIFQSDYSFSDTSYSTLLVGGYGEYVINFGMFFGLVFYLIFGIILGLIDSYSTRSSKQSTYNLLSPILVLLSIQLLMSDSNVISQYLFRFLSIPLVVLFLCPKNRTYNVIKN